MIFKCAIFFLVGYFEIAFSSATICNHLNKETVSYYDNLQKKEMIRDYYLYLPSSYCLHGKFQQRPVIYGLHGFHGTASGFAFNTTEGALNQLANEKNFIMVYPQGMYFSRKNIKAPLWKKFYSSWNFLIPEYYNPLKQKDTVYYQQKYWPICNIKIMKGQNPIPKQPGCYVWNGVCAWTSCFDDASYLLAVQKAVIQKWQGNPARQYLIGFSNGAMMTYRMTCQYPEKFQAGIAISGTTARHMLCYSSENAGSGNPFFKGKRGTSLLILTGADDTSVPLIPATQKVQDNLYYYESAPKIVKNWAKDMGCRSKIKREFTHLLDGLYCIEYQNCRANTKRVSYCIWGLNKIKTMDREHNYPGAKTTEGWCVGQEQKSKIPFYPLCPQLAPSKEAKEASQFIYNFLIRAT